MNNARRKELNRAISLLQGMSEDFERVKEIIGEAASAEREAFENLSEGLQQSDQGQRTEQAADMLESLEGDLDGIEFDNLVSQIEEATQ